VDGVAHKSGWIRVFMLVSFRILGSRDFERLSWGQRRRQPEMLALHKKMCGSNAVCVRLAEFSVASRELDEAPCCSQTFTWILNHLKA
jgi:hypothetical protein